MAVDASSFPLYESRTDGIFTEMRSLDGLSTRKSTDTFKPVRSILWILGTEARLTRIFEAVSLSESPLKIPKPAIAAIPIPANNIFVFIYTVIFDGAKVGDAQIVVVNVCLKAVNVGYDC
jgi:hypothetical protein